MSAALGSRTRLRARRRRHWRRIRRAAASVEALGLAGALLAFLIAQHFAGG